MKRFIVLLALVLFCGCQRGDFRFSIVHKGDESPHDGFFVNETWYVETGQTVTDDGYIVWIDGIEPQ